MPRGKKREKKEEFLFEEIPLPTGDSTLTVDTSGTAGVSVSEQKRRDLQNDLNGDSEPEDVPREEK